MKMQSCTGLPSNKKVSSKIFQIGLQITVSASDRCLTEKHTEPKNDTFCMLLKCLCL